MPLDLVALVAPAHTALVLQEVQNGVVGSPSVLPALAEAAAAVDLVGNCARLAQRRAPPGVTVVHCTAETRDDARARTTTRGCSSGVKKAAVPAVAGQRRGAGARARSASTRPTSCSPRYHGLGPMTGTQLDPILRNLGVTTIVGVGVSLNVGMTNLAFDAVNRGYQIVLPRDAVAGVPRRLRGRGAREHAEHRRDAHDDRRRRLGVGWLADRADALRRDRGELRLNVRRTRLAAGARCRAAAEEPLPR